MFAGPKVKVTLSVSNNVGLIQNSDITRGAVLEDWDYNVHCASQQELHLQKWQAVGGRPPRMPPPLSSHCGRRSALRRRADGNVAAVFYGQHVLTPTAAAAWRANTAVSKAAWWPWPLTFWPWKWCPSRLMSPPIRGGGIIMPTADLDSAWDVWRKQVINHRVHNWSFSWACW